GVDLPQDGTYTVEVRAASGHAASTGGYTMAVYDATVNSRPLVLGQPAGGTIDNAFAAHRWAFTATAGEQVQLVATANPSGLAFDLTGPGGFSGFANLTGNSGLVTLPASGGYTLTVHSAGGRTGAYAFTLLESTVDAVPLGGSAGGTLVG